MKAIPIVIAAFAVVVIIHLRVRHRGRSSSPLRARAARVRDRRLFGDTGLVARREIRERLRGRVFWVVTVILFGVVAAAVVIPTLHGKATQSAKVGVVAGSASLRTRLEDLVRSVGLTVRLVSEADLSQARVALDSGRLDMVIDRTQKILVQNPVSTSDTSAGARYVREVSLSLGEQRAYAKAGLTSGQAAIVAGAQPLPVESTHPGKARTTTSETTALLGVILIFVVLSQYLTWMLMGVMEEKASRVVEVLLATVRPIQLLAGKVIGIGAVALAQAGALVVFALVLGEAVGSSLVHGTAPLVVAAILVWLVLGYAFYSWVYAAAGSLAERQDQLQSLALPLALPLVFGYIVSLIGVSSGSASTLVKVLAYLPPTAPFAMPTLVGFGQATWWQFLLSVVFCLACIVVVAFSAARIYRAAVLKTGGRVRLRQLRPTSTK
ncbi:MAG TPA: ABC transporter permease [Actinomycetes bacterium]|jgi:ABC-2 type transport system permease protein|nr:ABC transporter permease [Actinomycetes bacterium]